MIIRTQTQPVSTNTRVVLLLWKRSHENRFAAVRRIKGPIDVYIFCGRRRCAGVGFYYDLRPKHEDGTKDALALATLLRLTPFSRRWLESQQNAFRGLDRKQQYTIRSYATISRTAALGRLIGARTKEKPSRVDRTSDRIIISIFFFLFGKKK